MYLRIFLLHFSLAIFSINGFENEKVSVRLGQWASEITNLLKDLSGFMQLDKLNQIYRRSVYVSKPVDDKLAWSFVDEAEKKISQIVDETESQVKSLKNDTENAYIKFSKTNYTAIIAEAVQTDRTNETSCYIRSKLVTSDMTNCVNNLYECEKSHCMTLVKDPILNNIMVNKTISTAHVPTNVYDLSILLRTVGNWTSSLDKVFIENRERDRTLKWQYFCSSTGIFKFFPGIVWHIQQEENEKFIDFFDCRSQSWYLGASSYPKEMVILMDKSGSMKGLNNIISNATMSELLNTLTENDFFNIIMFDHEIHYADPMVNNTLLQASKQNMHKIIRSVSAFKPNSTAGYENALTEAFKLLSSWRNNSEPGRLGGCNQQIMIITDSAPESFDLLLKEINPKKSVRIFTYLIGQHSAEEEILARMACNNRGFAVSITALSDVKENVLKYLDVVARSNAIEDKKFLYWTGANVMQFKDRKLKDKPFDPMSIIDNKALSDLINEKQNNNSMQKPNLIDDTIRIESDKLKILKPQVDPDILKMDNYKINKPEMYTSAAMSSYDLTNKSRSEKKGILLGVVGVDVSLQEFMDTSRGHKIGPDAYLFGVNNNGHVLFHPNYRPMYKSKLKSLYQYVDILDVEVYPGMEINRNSSIPEYDQELRNIIIERSRSSTTLATQTTFNNFRNSFMTKRKYFVTPIKKTPFVIGIALPWGSDAGQPIPYYQVSESNFVEFGVDFRAFHQKFLREECPPEDYQIATLINYEFCDFTEELKALYLINPICAMRQMYHERQLNSNKEKCDIYYLNSVIKDAQETEEIMGTWQEMENRMKDYTLKIQQLFMLHHSGLIRYHNITKLRYPDFINDHLYGSEDPIYLATIHTAKFFNEPGILVFHPPISEFYANYNTNEKNVTFEITSAVFQNNDINKPPFVVSGVQLDMNQFNSVVDELIENCSNKTCYIITESLIIINNNGPDKKVGQSLQEIECDVVKAMLENDIVKRRTVYDFQGICMEVVKKIENFSIRLGNPIFSLVKYILQAVVQFMLFTQKLLIMSVDFTMKDLFEGEIPSIKPTDHNEDAHIKIQITKSIDDCRASFLKQNATYNLLRQKALRNNETLLKNSSHIPTNLPLKNSSEEFNKPGDLLECLKKIVKVYCGSNSQFTPSSNRFQCDYSCGIIRSRHTKIVGELDLCQEPNNPCTKVYEHLHMNTEKSNDAYGVSNCTSCNKNWYLQRISGANLYILAIEQEQACSCVCSSYSAEGKQMVSQKDIPLPVKKRVEIPQLDTCKMIEEERENSTYCDAIQIKTNHFTLLIFLFFIHGMINNY